MGRSALYRWYAKNVWARHNTSRPIQQALRKALRELDASPAPGLNVGCGSTDLHPRMLRVDVDPSALPDYLSSADKLPFADNTFSVAVSQEVLEHLREPQLALAELARVVRPGGLLYLQTPFIIGYHAAPADYWRFTNEGMAELLQRSGLVVEVLEPAVGPGTGLYRIVVEFAAVLAARLYAPAYLPSKALAAALLSPLRWFDVWLSAGEQRWRIPGGCLALARKPI
jgi:SAM-dependent methyltransferase